MAPSSDSRREAKKSVKEDSSPSSKQKHINSSYPENRAMDPYQQYAYAQDYSQGYTQDYGQDYVQGGSSSQMAPQYVRPEKAEDWEPYRHIIATLYQKHKLKDVMEEMENVYFFKATMRQYKGKIKQWGLDNKYVKTDQYLEALEVQKQREKEGSSTDEPVTVKGGKQVSGSSIARFEKRHAKRTGGPAGGDHEDADSDAGLGSSAQWGGYQSMSTYPY